MLPPEACEGPARLLVASGLHAWNVYVKTGGEEAKLELRVRFDAHARYELRISEAGDTITWEWIKLAAK